MYDIPSKTQVVSAAGAQIGFVPSSGVGIRITDVALVGINNIGASAELHNGSTNNNFVLYLMCDSTSNSALSASNCFNLAEGFLFDAGCYLVTGTNLFRATVTYQAHSV